jgi:hypothetical protein
MHYITLNWVNLELIFMEKILGYFIVAFFTLLSCVSSAETEETFTYGTPYSTPDLNLSGLGTGSSTWQMGGGMGGGPSAADMAAKEKAEQDGKRKYCKDNGYPANVPFCAGFKEEAIQACEQGVKEMYRLEVTDAQNLFSASRRDCYSTYASPELLASRESCLGQAQGHYRSAVDSSQDNKGIRLGNCSKSP